MKNRYFFLLITFTCMLFCLPSYGQKKTTVRDLIEAEKDTIVKIKKESYHSKYGKIILFKNVNYKGDIDRKHNDGVYVEDRTRYKSLLKKVFPQKRFDELAQLNASFMVQAICDSTGNVLECIFYLPKIASDITLEEIVEFEKVMKKDYKEKYRYKPTGVEAFEITYPFFFGKTPAERFKQRRMEHKMKKR